LKYEGSKKTRRDRTLLSNVSARPKERYFFERFQHLPSSFCDKDEGENEALVE
jgi:hypothetical protein